MIPFFALLKRDLTLAWREDGSIMTALSFFVLVIMFLPLGLGPDPNLLSRIAAGMVWIALLLATLLSMSRIFANDYQDGTLEILMLGPLPTEMIVVAKSLAHWISHGIPLSLLAPILGLTLNLETSAVWLLSLTAIIGTLAFSCLGAIGAALTLGIKRGGLLMPLLILPFYIPILIFGVSTIAIYITGPGSYLAPFMILCGIALGAFILAPIAAAAALRMTLQ